MTQLSRRLPMILGPMLLMGLLALGVVQGCSGSSGSTDGGVPRLDGGTVADGGARTDGGVRLDGGVDGGAQVDGGAVADGGAGCSVTGFTAAEAEAMYGLDSNQQKDFWRYTAVTSTSYPLDVAMIENWVSYGGPSTPGTYSITANEASYLDCGFCVIFSRNCTSDSSCGGDFMPKPGVGSFTLTTLGKTPGSTFSGTLTGVVLQEVTIDPESLETTPVPNGQTWCLPTFTWTGTIVAPSDGG
jgi:hypothetical protein